MVERSIIFIEEFLSTVVSTAELHAIMQSEIRCCVSHLCCSVPTVTNPCASNPCENGGTCKTLELGLYRCHCGIMYSGQHCEKGKMKYHTNSLILSLIRS